MLWEQFLHNAVWIDTAKAVHNYAQTKIITENGVILLIIYKF